MPLQKMQMHRLMHIAAMLKENRYPNKEQLRKDFRNMALEEGVVTECSTKTIQRDLKVLKEEFHCPLAFDYERNGYYLKHHGWNFISPALLDENEMLASVIGARISEAIFPPPLRNKIRAAVDYLLQNNNPDFLDTADLKSLNILSGLYANLDKDIFMTVFEGWEKRRCIKIGYMDYTGKVTVRTFEPHTLVFYENSWYSKGICHLKKAPRTFALQRIRSAELLEGEFQQDEKLIDSINMDDFLGFGKIKEVKLQVSEHVKERLAVSPLHSQQVIVKDLVSIPAVAKETLFPFLLSQRGEAILLEPEELRQEFRKELRKMLASYQ